MLPILSFLAVIAVSFILVRVATVTLTHTGLSAQLASFQARPPFTGAGFTTKESEEDYVVAELAVEQDDWMCGRSLQELRLNGEGLLVLGINRASGDYVGAPRGSTKLQPDDTAIFYGRRSVIEQLDQRERGREGAWEHLLNVEEQKAIEASEAAQEDQGIKTKAA